MAKISKKLQIKWNFELTVFKLTVPDLYITSKFCKMWCLLNLVLAKFDISLVLLNFLGGCNFALQSETPYDFGSDPYNVSEVTRNTWNYCLKFSLPFFFCHICYRKSEVKIFSSAIKVKLVVIKQLFQKLGFLSIALNFSQLVKISNKFTQFERK